MKPCDQDIFEKGESVASLYTESAETAEGWVQTVAEVADVLGQLDWHYCGGRVHLIYLGNAEGRERVETAINKLEASLEGIGGGILRRFAPEEQGLYRRGVTPTPKGALAYDSELGFIGEDET
ncbi:MAG: hypothetical protein ABH849_03335 [Nanoarchaeota archaeon]